MPPDALGIPLLDGGKERALAFCQGEDFVAIGDPHDSWGAVMIVATCSAGPP
jgi:hypothetical protein